MSNRVKIVRGDARALDFTDASFDAIVCLEAAGDICVTERDKDRLVRDLHRVLRPGGHVGFVGVSHGVQLPGQELFYAEVHLHGGPAPVRRFLPELIELIWNRQIDPEKVFDLELPLDDAAAGYEAMDERRAIKALLRP